MNLEIQNIEREQQRNVYSPYIAHYAICVYIININLQDWTRCQQEKMEIKIQAISDTQMT